MTTDETQRRICEIFSNIPDDFDQYNYLVSLALSQDVDFDEELRQSKYEIAGCQSKLWAFITLNNGLISIRCDSDSLIVKGLALLIAKIFNGHTPEEAKHSSVWFLETILSDNQLFSDTKNGLIKLINRIKNI